MIIFWRYFLALHIIIQSFGYTSIKSEIYFKLLYCIAFIDTCNDSFLLVFLITFYFYIFSAFIFILVKTKSLL